MMFSQGQVKKPNISVKEEMSETDENQYQEGRYADTYRVGHSAYKFVFDFGQRGQKDGKPIFITRVIMGPDNTKDFLKTLEKAIHEHENQFGRIVPDDE